MQIKKFLNSSLTCALLMTALVSCSTSSVKPSNPEIQLKPLSPAANYQNAPGLCAQTCLNGLIELRQNMLDTLTE